MSKERLESLKRNREWTEATGGKFYTVDSDDYKWLIKQAELAQKYDRELISLEDNKHYVSEMLAKNKRYREALEEIAQKRMTYADMAEVLMIARKALEELKNEQRTVGRDRKES